MTRPKLKAFNFLLNTEGQNEAGGIFTVQPNSAAKIENMHVDEIGQWSSHQQGYDNFTAQLESGADVDALGSFTNDSGTSFLLEAINGKIKNINPGTGAVDSEISTAFTAGNPVAFDTLEGNVYAAEKSLDPQKWNGTGNMSAAGGIPLTVGSDTYAKPEIVVTYANRLTYAKFNGTTLYPSHIAISDDLDPEVFTIGVADTDGAVLPISPGDGQVITGARRLTIRTQQGEEEVLVIFKDRSTYVLSGKTPNTFAVNQLSNSEGALNHRCIVQLGNELVFIGENDIHSLSTASDSGKLLPRALGSEKIKNTLQTLNLSQKDKAWAMNLPNRKEIWFGIPTGANTDPDLILIYSYLNVGNGPQNAWSIRKNTTELCGVCLNKEFFTGDNNGYIKKWFNSSKYGSNAIAYKYQYPFTNFGTQHQNKRIVQLSAWFLIFDTQSITVTTEWRGGGNNTRRAISKTLDTGGTNEAKYGTGIYGISLYGNATILKKVPIPVLGNGEQAQITVEGNTGDSGVIFLGCTGLIEFLDFSRGIR